MNIRTATLQDIDQIAAGRKRVFSGSRGGNKRGI